MHFIQMWKTLIQTVESRCVCVSVCANNHHSGAQCSDALDWDLRRERSLVLKSAITTYSFGVRLSKSAPCALPLASRQSTAEAVKRSDVTQCIYDAKHPSCV